MKNSLWSLLVLILMFGLTFSACTKKEQPAETAMELPAEPTADDLDQDAALDLDEDIFDLDETLLDAQEAADEVAEDLSGAASDFADETTGAFDATMDATAESFSDAAQEEASLLLGDLPEDVEAASTETAAADSEQENEVPAKAAAEPVS
ncbi:MAG TPA: hypothetical protein PLY88_08520 [Candidatus Omnitrophota bacterium]|nr:hypothetical protein [Candidatus Omnitrophota bacterium]HRK62568.1 hypothetical protein [Candidatus Omnitrophota bacterium]